MLLIVLVRVAAEPACKRVAVGPREVVAVEQLLVRGALDRREQRVVGCALAGADVAQGSIAAYYPEANPLCPLDFQDPQSGTPSYKCIPVRIRKTD